METCRTCAKCDFGGDDNDKWLNIFHPDSCQNEMQSIRVELDIWKLKIKPNDGLPQKICTDCFTKFCTVHKLRRECQEAQLLLKSLFENIESHSELDNSNISNDLNLRKPQIANQDLNECSQKIVDQHFSTDTENVTEKELDFCITTDTVETDELINVIEKDTCEYTELNTLPNRNDSTDVETSDENDPCDQNDLVTIETADIINTTIEEEPPSKDCIYMTVNNDIENKSEKISILELSPINNNCIGQQPTDCADEISFTFECKYCYKIKDIPAKQFLSQGELLDHVSQFHDSVNPYDCPHCDKKYPDAPSRTMHIKDQHVEKQHACDVCGKMYADRFNLRHHIEKYHNKVDFKCDFCDKRFTSRKSLKHHSQWHMPERQLKCTFCDRLFISERQLKMHETTHTGLRNSECCTFCGKSFFQIKTLRWHIYKNHGGQKPYKCTLCTEVFDSYKKKRLHMLENHAKHLTSVEKSQCMICNKKFPNETDLQKHMNNNHDDSSIAIVNDKRVLQTKKQKQFSGVFQCEECPQRFNLKSALVRHSAVHNVEGRPHACTECKKRFKRIQDLRWHMKTHSTEKPNICDVCGKGFALKYVLTQHRKSHEALEKCFQCATCGRTYLFEKSLRLHERIHTGKTYYNCDLCGEKFVTHIKFLGHMRKIHTNSNNKDQPYSYELVDDVTSE